MWTVVFTGKFYKSLEKFLFNTSYENGCFLLANSYKTKNNFALLITDVIEPTKNSWNYCNEHSLEPSSSFVNQCVMAADAAESSLVFVHTHPNPLHPPTFSWIDKETNNKIFANLSSILPDRPLGSLVFSKKGMCGIVFDKKRLENISKIKIVGNTLSEFPGIGFKQKSHKIRKKFDRQVRAIGEQSQIKLENMTAAVVGIGGTGSPVAVQLARMGIKNLQLIDKDKIDETNLPRIYGSKDADIGKPKVKVLKKHIESFSKSKINAIYGDVTDKKMLESLIASDVIFACVDNLTSRAILNEISNKYYIPLIDVGCRIYLNEDKSISQAIAKVQTVTPDSACLWCTGTLDGKTILEESYSKEEKKKLAKEGYYDEIGKQPSVISLTTMAASMAVNKLLSLVGVFGDEYNSRTQIELKNGFFLDDEPKIKTNCICQKNRGKVNLKN